MTESHRGEESKIRKEFVSLRKNFRVLLAANPNYFGNLEGSNLKPIFPLSGNTTFERLGCVGFHPELSMLKGVVYVNQESGYGTGFCGDGTTEFVRFFLSFDNGATWQDQGLTSFDVYNIDHNARLEFAVEKKIQPPRKLCRRENLIRVRAILSWQTPPPPDPNWMPVWGNRVEAVIQVDPYRRLPIAEVKLDADLLELIEPNQYFTLKKTGASIDNLAKAYAAAKVEPHRAVLPYLMEGQSNPTVQSGQLALAAEAFNADLLNVIDVIASPGDGNTSYEELTCVGMQPGEFIDELTGIIHVKKSAGYLGSLCTSGSKEYVAYYLDFGGGWQYMGTASVGVNDISSIPAEGLRYAAYLPVDLNKYRKDCSTPTLVKMRAILSWSVPPTPGDPEYKPFWGNREETLILMGKRTGSGEGLLPFITACGRVSVEKIDAGSGLATALSPFVVNSAPFGGEVMVSGYILNHPNHSATGVKLRYKVMISSNGVNFFPATDNFTISIDEWVGAVVTQSDIVQSVDGAGFYRYQVDGIGPNFTFVDENVLFRFPTAGINGPRWIRIDIEDPATLAIVPSNSVKLMIDNTAPDLSFLLTSASPCSDINPGQVLSGTYNATDLHMGEVSISVAPAGGTLSAVPAVSTLTQKSGTWSLNTTGMAKCGYVLQAYAYDRAIVNNNPSGNHTATINIGFCLR
ncbi:MAG: hypothetical protein SFV18_12325 [Bryobacteraceae bacterium]|nr:hypothetical protein [Bryobacteraceae bacterium]